MPRYFVAVTIFLLIALIGQSITFAQKNSSSNKIQYELDNGLKVTLMPLSSAKSNALVVLFDVGNRYDPPGKSGMSHMAEHFYVTAATEGAPSRDVRAYMAAYPEGANAQTGDDYTVIATVFKPERLTDELKDAAARMNKVTVDQADLDRELPRLELELRNMYSGFPMLAVANQGRQLRSPLPHEGRRGGKMDDLKSISVNEIQDWLDQHYKPGNARLILVGAFDTDEAKLQIKEMFSPIEQGTVPTEYALPKQSDESKLTVTLESLGQTASHRVCYTYQAPKFDDPLYAAFMVHAFQMQMQSMRGGTNGGAPPFMLRPLDDPDFFYASVNVESGESETEALDRLDDLIQKQLKTKLKKHHVSSTESNLALFLATKELPPRMLGMNPYGTAFSEGRRQQLGLDSKKLKAQFAKVNQKQMDEAADKFFGESNRVTIIAKQGE